VNNGQSLPPLSVPPEFYALRIDPINGTGQLLSGTISQQIGVTQANNASLSGILVMQESGALPGGTQGIAAAGLATFDGMGNITAVDVEQNVGGAFTLFNNPGSYAVSNNARVVITAPGLPGIGYLITPNKMFAITGTPDASLAFMQQQLSGAPFSNGSLSGYCAAGSLAPVVSNVTNSVLQLTADGNGNLTGVADNSGPNGLQSNVNTAITYSLNAVGKSPLSGSVTGYMYLGGFDEIEEPEFVVVTGETYRR
jgi:hypothetical protein